MSTHSSSTAPSFFLPVPRGFFFQKFPKTPTKMRAGRKGGFRGEFRPALHILRLFHLFRATLRFLRNCGSFYLKFELFLLKILQIKEVRRHGRRGVGRNAVPPSYCFFLFFRHALVELGRCGSSLCGASCFRTSSRGLGVAKGIDDVIIILK